MKTCKLCDNRTEFMYQRADGLYCQKHWQIGIKIQKMLLAEYNKDPLRLNRAFMNE